MLYCHNYMYHIYGRLYLNFTNFHKISNTDLPRFTKSLIIISEQIPRPNPKAAVIAQRYIMLVLFNKSTGGLCVPRVVYRVCYRDRGLPPGLSIPLEWISESQLLDPRKRSIDGGF